MNGWKNYETWITYCWLMNDRYIYFEIMDLASKAKTKEHPVVYMADSLKNMVEDGRSDGDVAGLYNDLIRHAVSEIDFYEIANSIMEE